VKYETCASKPLIERCSASMPYCVSSYWRSLSNVELKLVTPNALVTGGLPAKPTGWPGTLGI